LAYNNAFSAYRDARVMTASQGQLVVMLYDKAVQHLDHGLELLGINLRGKRDPGAYEEIGKSLMKAQDIITELTVSLDFDKGGDIARNLFSLYTWFNHELLEANINQDVRRITIIRNMLRELRGAWGETAAQKPAEAAAAGPRPSLSIAG